MTMRLPLQTLVVTAALLAADGVAAQGQAVKDLFGTVPNGAPMQSEAIGFYTRGCLAGGERLAEEGPGWQAMRLSRNRNWGAPVLVDYIERLAKDVTTLDDWPGILVGDMAQPRGGPMGAGHASHQTGLDADIWFDPMPDRILTPEEREEIGARSYIRKGTKTELDTDMWTEAHSRMIRRAASYPEVQRIFVNAGVKKELCDWAGEERAWLAKVRPWYFHDDHLHVRLKCPPGMNGCEPQPSPGAGDGCGAELRSWLKPAPPPKPAKGPFRYKPELTIDDLPDACRMVLAAGDDGIEIPPGPYVLLPRLRPRSN